jgi:rubrerythrin
MTQEVLKQLKPNSRRRTVLEAIKTFWGKVRGLHGERSTIVEQGFVWRCTECNHVFLTRTTAEQHPCPDQKLN